MNEEIFESTKKIQINVDADIYGTYKYILEKRGDKVAKDIRDMMQKEVEAFRYEKNIGHDDEIYNCSFDEDLYYTEDGTVSRHYDSIRYTDDEMVLAVEKAKELTDKMVELEEIERQLNVEEFTNEDKEFLRYVYFQDNVELFVKIARTEKEWERAVRAREFRKDL